MLYVGGFNPDPSADMLLCCHGAQSVQRPSSLRTRTLHITHDALGIDGSRATSRYVDMNESVHLKLASTTPSETGWGILHCVLAVYCMLPVLRAVLRVNALLSSSVQPTLPLVVSVV